MAPPLIFPSVEPAAAALTDSCAHSQRKVDAGQCARLPALIAALSSPDREIVLLRVVAGVSVPDIVLPWVSRRPQYTWPSARP